MDVETFTMWLEEVFEHIAESEPQGIRSSPTAGEPQRLRSPEKRREAAGNYGLRNRIPRGGVLVDVADAARGGSELGRAKEMFHALDANRRGYLERDSVRMLAEWYWNECHPSGAFLPEAEKERLTDEVATLTASVDELSRQRGWFRLASGGRGGGVAAKGDAAKSSRAARGGSDSSTGGAAEAKKALAKLRDGKIML